MRVKLEERLAFFLHELFRRPFGSFGELTAAKSGAKAYFQWEFDQADRSYSEFQPYIDLKDKDVLDVGCGLGGKTLFHLQKGARSVTGLDISQTNVQIAQSCFAEREPASSRHPWLVVADAAAMPFADNSFDLAISTYTFEHLADPARALEEIERVIKPGGEVFISFPPYFSPWGAHLTDWIHFPWCQVLFSERALLNVARAIEETEHVHASLPDFARIDLAGAVELPHVNKLTVSGFERLLEASSLEILSKTHRPVGAQKARVLRPVLSLATKIPILREAFTSVVVLVGRKPV
ncbi:MAG: class I SAM-dependent methyltransferase [Anaerolineales bacterium]|nr:class I SAM-dependent methyltransferase [Anaerolineales bacterium]